ncbi:MULTISPECIES: hypothetical protein [Bradyrhizobium]|uniref:hypothetical protein n=2 Tax=Nitrobacteraceae TaxID=41294 RepID=UPI0004181684|nr:MULTISPECIES: hypothetical protein [Bradyrhizobium]AUC99921.1 hypothetical protein CWS35_30425 [Bradyrhizobium sp. SK17]KIU43642.1 signal peptide protein [Bradyrhizobium elkanii]MBK5653372.1 hypothetical protein [Rhizobium sp.]OCX29017.1 hypothetical protein QU42_22215 [Bradyrhizobium sp. UASWS1016]
MTSLQSIILTLAVAYAVIGALLLIVLVYARLHWSLKAVVIVVTSAFYFVSFGGMRGLLGWASAEKLPANFKLLSTRIVEPHSLEGDPGSIYLWVEELDEDNRPSAVPRAFRIPYSEALAEQTHTADNEIKAGRPQGGRAADFGGGDGTIMDFVREYITPKTILETSGGDSTTGTFVAPPAGAQGSVFTPLPPPRMPPKDAQQ